MPLFLDIPIGFQNQAFFVVTQEELHYQNGNTMDDIGFEDCLSWEDLSMLARECSHKCLPVIAQGFYNENLGQPRCHNGIHHHCMWKKLFKVPTYSRI